MDLYKKLKLHPTRSDPDVWVSRLMIFEQILPDPVVIRDIALTRGLNIIWAEEAEDESASAEITGHSAGKTTFCRLLRHILGEKTFGTKAAMELIRAAFPEGYVAAELHVRSKKWAVRRPFGSGRMSYITENASIEEMLEKHGRSVTQESYPQEIGLESLLDGLETCGIVQTGEPIQWEHILAWCTRDQETRFQNIHDWRSPRSEADSPAFRFPTAGPLFVMRAVLGLFLRDELEGEERLAELQREKDRLIKEIEEKKREPQFRVNLYTCQLRQALKSQLPDESDIDSRPFRSDDLMPEDLERLTAKARRIGEEFIENSEQERRELQAYIDDLGAQLRQEAHELEELEAFFNLDTAAERELDDGLSKREEQRKKLGEVKDKICPLGNVVFRDCSYIQGIQRILQMNEFKDTRAMKQAEIRRAEECKRIKGEKDRLLKTIQRKNEERQNALDKRDALTSRIYKQRDSMRDLERTHDDLVVWMHRQDQPGIYEELDLSRQQLDTAETETTKVKEELEKLLRQHDENRELLAAIFSGAVRSVLSSDKYDGQVSLENRELAFHITQGPAMSGEAIETLSVLLADLACLVYNTVSDKAQLPGFLMHDSPREADLGIRIYRSLIRFAGSLQDKFGELDKCPYQYVLTTTTPPPKEFQNNRMVRLHLNASVLDELLLRCNIAEQASPDVTLL